MRMNAMSWQALGGATGAMLVVGAMLLSGCSQVIPPSPEEIVQNYLTHQGLHVVDINRVGRPNSDGYTPARSLCMSAPYSVEYRAYQQDSRTVIGLACVEQDNTVIIQLQKVYG
jgi:hypothetical protein